MPDICSGQPSSRSVWSAGACSRFLTVRASSRVRKASASRRTPSASRRRPLSWDVQRDIFRGMMAQHRRSPRRWRAVRGRVASWGDSDAPWRMKSMGTHATRWHFQQLILHSRLAEVTLGILMNNLRGAIGVFLILALAPRALAKMIPEQIQSLPLPASRKVVFDQDIKPIFEASCVRCHARGRSKG